MRTFSEVQPRRITKWGLQFGRTLLLFSALLILSCFLLKSDLSILSSPALPHKHFWTLHSSSPPLPLVAQPGIDSFSLVDEEVEAEYRQQLLQHMNEAKIAELQYIVKTIEPAATVPAITAGGSNQTTLFPPVFTELADIRPPSPAHISLGLTVIAKPGQELEYNFQYRMRLNLVR